MQIQGNTASAEGQHVQTHRKDTQMPLRHHNQTHTLLHSFIHSQRDAMHTDTHRYAQETTEVRSKPSRPRIYLQ